MCIRNTVQTVYASMRDITVALPAMTLFAKVIVLRSVHFCVAAVEHVTVAPDAVLLNNFLSGLLYKNYLWLSSQGENGGVPQSILRFEIIMIEEVVVRNMTIVAYSAVAVRAVKPRAVLRSHDVAVHARVRVV